MPETLQRRPFAARWTQERIAIVQNICDGVGLLSFTGAKLRYMAALPEREWSMLRDTVAFIEFPSVQAFLEKNVKEVVRLFPEAAKLREAKPDA